MADYFSVNNLVAFITLLALEIVLGIDNVIFIAILSGKLPEAERGTARTVGISLAVITRILLLLAITWVMRLTQPLFTIFGHGISGRDLILLVGGVFLIAKSVHELHSKLEEETHERGAPRSATFWSVIAQIVILDIVFSLDSVITAVGISGNLAIMIPAVVVAAGVMLFAAGAISNFVEHHPTMKILALAFLILIGVVLVIEGWNADAAHEMHIKNYAYFAMAFAVAIEFINMRFRTKAPDPVHLRNQPSMSDALLPDTNIEMASDVY